MDVTSLRQDLVNLLVGHGVRAELREDAVYLPEMDRWANLWLTRSPEGRFVMDLRATSPDGGTIADQWAALGTDTASATRDGLTSFCRCGFHVVLAALWGVLEADQVDHEVREVGGATWDLYLGPYSGRASSGVEPLAAPPGLVDEVLRAFDASLGAGETHAMRVHVASVNGEVTFEALVDGEASNDVVEAVARATWAFPPTGFVSLRWFVMAPASRRQACPPHDAHLWGHLMQWSEVDAVLRQAMPPADEGDEVAAWSALAPLDGDQRGGRRHRGARPGNRTRSPAARAIVDCCSRRTCWLDGRRSPRFSLRSVRRRKHWRICASSTRHRRRTRCSSA